MIFLSKDRRPHLCFAACALALATASAVPAQQLTVTGIQIGADQRARIDYLASSNSYYLLLRGSTLSAITQRVGAALFSNTNASFSDPALASSQATFYRVQGIPVSAPEDSDHDGRDDVFELLHPLYLDPLNPNDGPPGPPTPVIVYPTNATAASFVIFSGRAMTNTLIRVEGGATFVTNRVDETGAFEVTVALNPNRLNRLFVTAVDALGEVSPPTPIDILQDSTPPYLFIDFPTNGMVLTTTNTLVAGRVGDALSGFLGLNVTVNGQEANVDVGIGPNGTFQRMPVELGIGTNQLTVVATDRLGNSISKSVFVIREEPQGPRLLALSGDLQETNILRRLPVPLSVKVTQPGGAPIANQIVNFQVTRSDGRLRPVDTNRLASDYTLRPDYSSNGAMFVQLLTDAAGEARMWWTMGTDAGHANNRVTVSGAGLADTVFFCASATALSARQINIGSGNNQRGETFGPAAEPLKVWVSDGNNPVAGVPVTFKITQGGGTLLPIVTDHGASPAGPGLRAASRPAGGFVLAAVGGPPGAGSDEVTVFTSITGHAEVDFTFGPAPGNQSVEAIFPGNEGLPASFTHVALARVPGQPTRFVGLVEDNAVQPVGRAHVELEVAGARYETFSDAAGRFAFSDIASGAGHLRVSGATATTLGTNAIPTNSFPFLQYTVLVVPNAENALPSPVLLPRLNPNNARWYYGTNDLVITCEGVAGLRMTIKANSMKHPSGEIVSPGRPAFVSLNQVHHDNIPMPMPDGASPPFAWTLQPGGATFDPPVQVEYPNMSGLAPGAAAFFLTFNHDTERFEIVASGHVTGDGSKIVTDIGAGLTISGWGCNCPPYAVAGKCCKEPAGKCKKCVNGKLTDEANGTPSDDGDACTSNDRCQAGVPKGDPGGIPNISDCGSSSPQIRYVNTETTNTSGENITRSNPDNFQLVGNNCYDRKSGTIGYQIGSLVVPVSITVAIDGYQTPNPVPGGNVNAGNYCDIITELGTYSILGRSASWHSIEASLAHERYHRDVDVPRRLAPIWAKFVKGMNETRIQCIDGKFNTGVLDIVRRNLFDTLRSEYDAVLTADIASHDANLDDGAYHAGQAVLDRIIQKIGEFADAQHFPDCPVGRPAFRIAAAAGPRLTNAILTAGTRLLSAGQSTDVMFVLQFSDGSTSNLPPSLIEFEVTDPGVLSITTNGRVTAIAAGSALVRGMHSVSRYAPPLTPSIRIAVGSTDDRDADGLPNEFETRVGSNPDNPDDTNLDADGDGLSNFQEYLRGTDPLVRDTDGDGASDADEAAAGENPLQRPALNGEWEVSVGAQTVQVNRDGSFELPNITAPDLFGAGGPGTAPDFLSDDFVRLTGHRSFFGQTIYIFSEPFRIQRGVSILLENLTYTQTPPPAPESIVVVPDSPVLNGIGQSTQVRVTATLAGGATADFTSRTTWTSYRSSNPGIATVDPDGMITARAKGMAFITAVNDGAAAVCQMDVAPGDPLTVVRGFVRDTNGAPVTDVSVSLTGLGTLPVVTGADGSFVFTNVPTAFGILRVVARIIGTGTAFFATINIDPIGGGISDAGTLVLRPGVAWIGPVSSVWHGPTNWSSGQVPGPGTDVFIAAPPGVLVTVSQGSIVVNNLVVQSPLRLTGGTLRAQASIQVSSPLQLNGGRLLNSIVDSSSVGVLGSQSGGSLEGVTLNCDLDVQNGTLNVVNGLVLNGLARVGNAAGNIGAIQFVGSQVLSGSGSVLFGSSGCNTLRVLNGSTTLTNRVFIHGNNGQLAHSTCVGGPLNVGWVNESTISADVLNGTLFLRGQPVRNDGQLLAAGGTLRVTGLVGNIGDASVSGGHLDLDGAYTNNLALPIIGGTLSLNGDWLNTGELRTTNSTLNLGGSFGLGDFGAILRSGGSVRVTGQLDGAGGVLNLDANTASWTMGGGTLRQLTVNASGGAQLLATSSSGTLDGVTLNCDLDAQNGTLNVVNGLVLNGLARVGNAAGNIGTINFVGSQVLSGSGSVLFGSSGCNTLRVLNGGTTLTNRVFIHGNNGQLAHSTCVGGPLNVGWVNEATISADVLNGTIFLRGQPVRNDGQLLTAGGTLRVIGLVGNIGNASVSGGHLDLDGTYTNNLALPIISGTLSLNGDWLNTGELRTTNSTLNLGGSFGLGDFGAILRSGGSVRVTGLLDGAGGVLNLDANTASWTMSGGTLRQLTVNASGGAQLLATSSSGTLDGVTLNGDLDAQNGTLNVVNGLILNGLARVGNAAGNIGTINFVGSQVLSGSGSVLFGSSGCNTLRVLNGGTTLTNRVFIHGNNGQLAHSTCVGGPLNVGWVNEATISADVLNGTIFLRGQPVRNDGQLLAAGGTLRVIGLVGNIGNASVSGGHLDLDGTYTNNLALPIIGGTLSLNGDWLNTGELRTTNSTLNLGGSFGLGDFGAILRSGGSVRVTGLLDGAGGVLNLDANTASWTMSGGTLRQLTVNASGGAQLLATSSSGTLDGVTLNGDLDAQNGTLNVVNGLILNGLARVGNAAGNIGTINFVGSQVLSGSGSVLFGSSGCNTLRVLNGGTTLTNRVFIHGNNGQLAHSTCVGGPLNVGWVNEATISADVLNGTIFLRGQPVRNDGQLLAAGGTLRVIGLVGNIGNASVSGGHLDLDGTYTNNLALPIIGGTLSLNGDWLNTGELRTTNSTLNLGGSFGLGDFGAILRSGGSVRVTGQLDGAGGVLNLDADTASWTMGGGTLRQLTVNASGGAQLFATSSSGTLDGVALNGDLDVQNGTLNVVNGLVLNGLARVGNAAGNIGTINFVGSQVLSGSGSVLFGSSGCNTLRVLNGGTTLTNRVFIHGNNGQLAHSTCVGGPLNVGWVNEATISADVLNGTIFLRGQPVRNDGQLLAAGGTLRVIGLVGNIGDASVSGGHLDLDGTYTNNLALPIISGTLSLNGDWLNTGELRTTNSTLNLGGSFGLGDFGAIQRSGGSVRVTGQLDGAGGVLNLDANTASWTMSGGTLRQLTVNASGGAQLLATSSSGTLDGVTLDSDLDVQNGTLNVVNGLVLNGVARVGNAAGNIGTIQFVGSQALSGTGSVLFGSSGCNTLRVLNGGTTLTNRVFIHGNTAQLAHSTCVGGPLNVGLVNEGTLSADVAAGTITIRAQPFINAGTTNSLNGGRLIVIP